MIVKEKLDTNRTYGNGYGNSAVLAVAGRLASTAGRHLRLVGILDRVSAGRCRWGWLNGDVLKTISLGLIAVDVKFTLVLVVVDEMVDVPSSSPLPPSG